MSKESMIATFLTTTCREPGLTLGTDSFSRHFSRQSVVSGGTSGLSKQRGGQECPPSLFFEDLLHAKVREFNPRYAEAEGALPGKFRHLHTDIYGNREFVEH